MAKRTMSEIEKDYKRIRKVMDTTVVTSIREIAQMLNLSDSEVKTSLAKHPRVEEKILAQLEKNKEEIKLKKELEAQKKSKKKLVKTTKNNSQQSEEEPKSASISGFVIDASITGTEDLKNILSKLCLSKEKIILTSITIKELEKMQKFNDVDAKDARNILAMAAENQDKFYTVLIDETLETPDDCIVKYCADNKDKVTLLTSDKTMALKARMYDVQTQYFKQTKNHSSEYISSTSSSNNRVTTLLAARKIGNKLLIANFNPNFRSISVISNGIEYKDGVYELKIGDNVYLASKKPDYMTFAHYKITSLSEENNCELIFFRRIYNSNDIQKLPKSEYKSFMRDFKYKYNF